MYLYNELSYNCFFCFLLTDFGGGVNKEGGGGMKAEHANIKLNFEN